MKTKMSLYYLVIFIQVKPAIETEPAKDSTSEYETQLDRVKFQQHSSSIKEIHNT